MNRRVLESCEKIDRKFIIEIKIQVCIGIYLEIVRIQSSNIVQGILVDLYKRIGKLIFGFIDCLLSSGLGWYRLGMVVLIILLGDIIFFMRGNREFKV